MGPNKMDIDNTARPEAPEVIPSTSQADSDFGGKVRSAVIWRSGTQILAQIISWGSTLAVMRILSPGDYGIFAMAQVVLVFLAFMSGHGFASSLIQTKDVSKFQIRQAFGILLLLNAGIALTQLVIASAAAAYYKQPIVAELLRWQALIYLATPFMVIPEVLMMRNLEFKKPAIINLLSAVVGVVVALSCAYSGWGVWTLIAAPIAIFWSRAVCLVIATRFYYWPSFDFRGAGHMVGFGTALLLNHFFWTIHSQADIFIAGRVLDPHTLGLYSEALFFALIFSSKFVPPLNEVAFPAYSKLQDDPEAFSAAFLKAVRLIMLIAFPFYFGMVVAAEPMVLTLLGEKWREMIPFVQILALAMPVMTLQILFGPATNALGKPKILMRNSIFGALVMPVIYYIAIQYGALALAWGWLISFCALMGFTYWTSHRPIGITLSGLLASIRPGLIAGLVMAAIVFLTDHFLLLPLGGGLPQPVRLAALVTLGGASYFAMLWYSSREAFLEAFNLVVKRKAPDIDLPAKA